MTRTTRRLTPFALAIVGSLLLAASSSAAVLEKSETGKPDIQSINVISFAPDGVLLIGDGRGAAVFAIETGDVKSAGTLSEGIAGIDRQIAARLGTKPEGIEIIDLAVNPASGTAYLAVRKQDDKQHVIITVNGDGKIGELNLDKVTYAKLQLSAGTGRVSNVTDVSWAEDRIVAAARSNEEFSSKIFSINAPLKHNESVAAYSAESYHVSHGRWETKAPMSVLIPFKENGKTYVIGAFSCTPIVKYPIDALQPGAKVQGVSVIELGSGNRPLDMFVYEKDGKPFVLANTFRFHHERKPFGPSPYWTVKFEQNLLGEDEKVNKEAVRRLKGDDPTTDRIQMVEAYHGVMQMDKLDNARALTLRQSEDGLDLAPLPLP